VIDARKLLINNRRGRLVGETWLRDFGLLTKPEQDVLLFLMGKKANNKDHGYTNQEIADGLETPLKKVFERTKALSDKAFIEFEAIQLKEKMKPVKHFFLPSNNAKYVPEPGHVHITNPITEMREKQVREAHEPTVDERTLKRVDADMKVGL